MNWKDKLRKLKQEAKTKKQEQKLEHHILAEKVADDIAECLEVLEEFSFVTNSKIKFFDNRHKEKDEETQKEYFTGGITLLAERRRTLIEKLLRPQNQKTEIIALIKFPHPKAIKHMEWYDDAIRFAYSDIRKRLPLSEFDNQWLKDNLEEAYQHFLTQRHKI